MHAFTQRLAARIEHSQADAIADSLVDAGEIMRIWHLFGGDPSGSAVVGPFSEQTKYPRVFEKEFGSMTEQQRQAALQSGLGQLVRRLIRPGMQHSLAQYTEMMRKVL